MAYVYVLQADDGLVKIGRSQNPERRCRHIAVGRATAPVLVYKQRIIVGSAHIVEQTVHLRLIDARVRGEWFNIALSQAIMAIQQVARELGEPA